MQFAVSTCAVVLLLVATTVAQPIGQGSSAQTAIAAKFARLVCSPKTVRYTPTSSVLGANALRSYLTTGVDFALSDLPVTPCGPTSTIVNIPYAFGLMSVATKPGALTGIKFTACALVRIYACIAKTFNDPVLVGPIGPGRNAGLATYTAAIRPIARKEVSGTTYTFTNFMAKACPASWRFGVLTLLGNAPALAPCFNSLTVIKAQGTSGVKASFAATPNSVAYATAGAFLPLNEVALQANVGPAGAYVRPSATNTALLVVGLNVGLPTGVCSNLLDITAVRQNTYPLAYVAFFFAFKAPRPVKPTNPLTKVLCNCLITQNAVLTAGLPDFRPIPAALAAVARARCALI